MRTFLSILSITLIACGILDRCISTTSFDDPVTTYDKVCMALAASGTAIFFYLLETG